MRKLSSSQSLFVSVLAGFLLAAPAALWLRDRAQQATLRELHEKPGMKPGQSAASMALKDLRGGTIDLLKPGGAYLLLCFFSAEGCPRCVEEAAVWKQLIAEGPRRNVRTFLVAAEKDGASLQHYLDARGLGSLPVLYDPGGNALRHFQVQVLPQYLLFDREGKVVHRELGYSSSLGIEPAQRTQAILGAITPVRQLEYSQRR